MKIKIERLLCVMCDFLTQVCLGRDNRFRRDAALLSAFKFNLLNLS